MPGIIDVNGVRYTVDHIETDEDFYLPLLVTEGDQTNLLVAIDQTAAGNAVRDYWIELLTQNPALFIEKIGGWGPIVAWLMGQTYAPNPSYGASFQEFLDYCGTHPEEFLDMDAISGHEPQGISDDLVTKLGYVPSIAYLYTYKGLVR